MAARNAHRNTGLLAALAMVVTTVAVTFTVAGTVSAASFTALPERLYMAPAGTIGLPIGVPIGSLLFTGTDPISGDARAIVVDVAEGSASQPTCDIKSPEYYYGNCSRVQLTASKGKIKVGTATQVLQNGDPAFPRYLLPGGAIIDTITPTPSGPSGIIHMNGTTAQLNAALANLEFIPDAGYVDTGSPHANLNILLSSADGTTLTKDVEIIVQGLNDWPTLTGPLTANAQPEVELHVDNAYDVADSDNDQATDGPGDKMLLVAIMTCGFPIDPVPPADHGFFLQGGSFQSDKDDIKELLQSYYNDVALEPVVDAIIDGLNAVDPTLVTIPLATSGPSTYKTAFAGIGTLVDVQYALDKVTFLHDVPDDTCNFLTVVSDLGNNGLPLQYVGSPPDGIEIPIPGFAVSNLVITMGKLQQIDASFAGGDVVLEDNPAEVTINITPATHPPFTLRVSTIPGTATPGADYASFTDATFSVAQDATSVLVSTQAFVDNAIEGDETFSFSITLPTDVPDRPLGWEVKSATPSAPVTIVDEDDGLNPLSISIEPTVSINEGSDGPVTITVSPATHPALSLTLTTADIDAIAAVDYNGFINMPVTIPANAATVDVDLGTIGNLVDAPDKQFSVTMTPPVEPPGFSLTVGNTVSTVTIVDNDDPIPLTVSLPSTLSIAEGATDPITISISPATHPAFSVTVATADVGATSPDDYTAINTLVNIPQDATSVTVPLVTIADAVVEASPQTFTFTLTTPPNPPPGYAFAATTAMSTVTITDDDSDPTAITVSVPSAVSIAEGASGPVTISISPATHPPFDVTVATADGSATVAGLDYTAITAQTVTIPANATSVPVSVTTLQDVIVEGPQTFTLTVTTPAVPPLGFTVTPPTATSTITITDDDAAPPAITISLPSTTSIIEGDVGSVPITISPATHPAFNVTVTTTDGTAVAPGDYTAKVAQVVTIPVNATTVDVSLTTIENLVDAADKTFTLVMASPPSPPIGFSITPGNLVTTVTIADDDNPPPPTALTISVPANVAISEGDVGQVAITVSPSTHPAFDVTVSTADGTAAAPGDYTAITTQVVTIPANAGNVDVNLTTIENAVDAADKTLTVTVTSPASPPIGFTISPAVVTSNVTITDDDAPPGTIPLTISVPPSVSVSEGDVGSLTVTISPAVHPTFNVTVSTANATAIAGTDYFGLLAQTVVVPADAASVNVSLPTIENAVDAADKTFTVTVSSPALPPVGFTVSPATVTSTITIVDDDGPVADPPSLTITVPANITVPNDPGLAGATVTYPMATATGGQPPIVVQFLAASGTFFALGTTTVTCTATDAALGGASDDLAAAAIVTGTFTVKVVDTEPPVIGDGPDITVQTDGNSALVPYLKPTATDNAGPPIVACTPASLTSFPLGTTTVTCTATDSAGLTASSSFTVTVVTGLQLPATGSASNSSAAVALAFLVIGLLLLTATQFDIRRLRLVPARRRRRHN